MELDEISYTAEGGIAEIVLDRPALLNPISARPGGTRDQILHAIGLAEQDAGVGCVLIHGAGRAFSSGGELGGTRREKAVEHLGFLEGADRFHTRLRGSRVPTVAAVHGLCLGAALHLVTACDFVIAGASARFGLPEGRIGLVGASTLVPVVGRQWAKFLMVTGELIDAERAREIGLVLTVEPDEAVVERSRDLARRIGRLPRDATLLNRRAIDAIADAAGDAAGRATALGYDTATLADSPRATAPDGRTFREILETEGMAGMKKARAEQYDEPWLS